LSPCLEYRKKLEIEKSLRLDWHTDFDLEQTIIIISDINVFSKGSYINDVTGLGEGYQIFCDNCTEALVLKSVAMAVGRGCVQNCPKLRDVIYGRPLRVYFQSRLVFLCRHTPLLINENRMKFLSYFNKSVKIANRLPVLHCNSCFAFFVHWISSGLLRSC